MRPEKTAIINEIRAKVTGSEFLILTNYKGMKVIQVKELRKRLSKHNSKFHVVKNSFLKIALKDDAAFKMDDDPGVPLALVTGKGDGMETVKVLDNFRKEFNVNPMESGILGGRHFSKTEFEQLVKLPSRSTLLGMLAGGLLAPINGLANVMNQRLSSLVYVLQAIQEAKSKSNK